MGKRGEGTRNVEIDSRLRSRTDSHHHYILQLAAGLTPSDTKTRTAPSPAELDLGKTFFTNVCPVQVTGLGTHICRAGPGRAFPRSRFNSPAAMPWNAHTAVE